MGTGERRELPERGLGRYGLGLCPGHAGEVSALPGPLAASEGAAKRHGGRRGYMKCHCEETVVLRAFCRQWHLRATVQCMCGVLDVMANDFRCTNR